MTANKSPIPKSKARTAYGLLSEVRALILAEPKRYHQGIFIDRETDPEDDGFAPTEGYPACGTIGCVAGWVATLKRRKKFTYTETPHIAQRVLGIDETAATELFAYGAVSDRLGPQSKRYASAGAAHIASFQKRYRAQLLAKKV